MSKYYRIHNGANKNSWMMSESEVIPYLKGKVSHFISTSYYTKEQAEEFKKTKSVAGWKDLKTNQIWFDFDSSNLNESRKDAVELYTRLLNHFLINNIELSFSGGKGFHVVVKLNGDLTAQQVKKLVLKLGKDLATLDLKIYDSNRILRAPNTKHEKTGLFKIPLTSEEFQFLPMEQVKELAKAPRDLNYQITNAELPKELLVEEEKPKQTVVINHNDPLKIKEIDFTNKPHGWKDYKWSIAQGRFEMGKRNHSFMVIASTCRALRYGRDHTAAICLAADKLHCEITGDIEADENALEREVLDVVFGNHWNGGQYSIENDIELRNYCEKNGFKLEKDDNVIPVINLQDVNASFKDFVKNIDKNTIKTGIKLLDDAVPITIGMNLGVVGAASSGKCLGKDTPIRMFNGEIKKVQDIKIGELLMGDDSTPRTVLSTCQGKEKLYKVIQENGDDYIVNASHILSLKTNENKGWFQKGNVVDMNVEEYINKSVSFKKSFKGYKVPVEYSEQKLEVDPYYLGLWLGDGSSYGTFLYTKDEEIEKFNEAFAKSLNLISKSYIDKRTNVKTVKVIGNGGKSNYLRQTMIALGLLKNQKHLNNKKHIPSVYMINSRENRLKLLAGLMDSDGTTRNHLTNFSITQSKKELSEQILELVRSLGFKATLNEVQKCATNGSKIMRTYYTVYFSGKNYDDLIKYMLLERKKPIKGTSKGWLTNTLSFEDLGEGDYYGFEIDGNHRFLLGDFTVTHNTALALEILKHTSMNGVVSVIASLDMHRTRLYEKVLYKVSHDIYKRTLSREELYKKFQGDEDNELVAEVKRQYGNVYFYDRSRPTVDDLRRFILTVEAQTGLKVKLLMVDYFERIGSDVSDATASSLKVANELQDILNDLNLAIVTLVQPNKFSLAGGPDSPILSYTAIKGSSFLYQSFRSIVSIWRPFFTPKTKHLDKFMEMAILKNDLGELDHFKFNWEGKTGKITEMSEEEEFTYKSYLEEKKDIVTPLQEEQGYGQFRRS